MPLHALELVHRIDLLLPTVHTAIRRAAIAKDVIGGSSVALSQSHASLVSLHCGRAGGAARPTRGPR
eukprot:1688068-Prymnesium_polylepis.1